jgi:hypothetical protein
MSFTPNYKGIGEMLRSKSMLDAMVFRAEKIKTVAEAIAPFDPGSKDGTHYRDAFRVETSTHGGIHKDRAEAKVVNDDAAAFYIEYGTEDTPRFRTLGKAADAGRT